MTALRPELPPLPWRLQALPVEARGYPVPRFVQWMTEDGKPCPPGEGTPDFRVANRSHFEACVKRRLCWLCGMELAHKSAFVIGPMCAINRVSSEPPSHVECARFAAMACPFLVRPHARRREAGLPENPEALGGHSIPRNPGVALVWITVAGRPQLVPDGMGGELFHVGEPIKTEWYREGRPATRAEVLESMRTGLPQLALHCQCEGDRVELERQRQAAMQWVPPA